jgi:hypothetical protein
MDISRWLNPEKTRIFMRSCMTWPPFRFFLPHFYKKIENHPKTQRPCFYECVYVQRAHETAASGYAGAGDHEPENSPSRRGAICGDDYFER